MTEPQSFDRPNVYPWPPIIYAAALLGAYVMERLLPFWPFGGWEIRPLGAIVAATGFLIAVAGLSHFQLVGTPFDPTGRAKVLATGGIYRFTRNPMYLGGVLFFTGLAFALRSGWLLLAAPAIEYGLQRLAIEPEDAYLTRRFGDEYRNYCAKVRRWV